MEGWDLRALAVLERLNVAGHRAVLVGGCVRDRLMGRTPHDYDAATSARPEQIREACAPMRVVETGVRHGTVTVLSGGLPVEVTTFRREGRYTDHRRPDRVEFTVDLGEDLARRDFTINAMAWEPSGLTDPFGGRADLAAGVIRCAASVRTPCVCCVPCGSLPSWTSGWRRGRPPACEPAPPSWPASPGSGWRRS